MAVLDVIKRSKGTAQFFSLLKQPAKTVTERAVELATSVYAGTPPEEGKAERSGTGAKC